MSLFLERIGIFLFNFVEFVVCNLVFGIDKVFSRCLSGEGKSILMEE